MTSVVVKQPANLLVLNRLITEYMHVKTAPFNVRTNNSYVRFIIENISSNSKDFLLVYDGFKADTLLI